MNLYTLALFAHIVGVVGIFADISIWLFSLARMRTARSVEQVRTLGGLVYTSGNLSLVSLLLLAVAGLYMALTRWGWQTPWIDVATVGVVLIVVLAFVMGPRMRAIVNAAKAAPEGELPAPLAALASDPVLSTEVRVYIAGLLGIVYLMTTKPGLGGAIAAMLVAAALGLVWSIPLWRAARSRTAVGASVEARQQGRAE